MPLVLLAMAGLSFLIYGLREGRRYGWDTRNEAGQTPAVFGILTLAIGLLGLLFVFLGLLPG